MYSCIVLNSLQRTTFADIVFLTDLNTAMYFPFEKILMVRKESSGPLQTFVFDQDIFTFVEKVEVFLTGW